MPNVPSARERPLWQRLLLRRLKFLAIVVAVIIVLGGATYLIAPQWLMRADAWRMASSAGLDTHTLQVGKTRWVYYEGGKGVTIVLLHGYGSNRQVWLKVAGDLTKNFHLIIPDLPGWGDSTRIPDADYGVQSQATRLYAFLHTLGVTHEILVGSSLGGAIAGYYASEHPDAVGSLVLMDSFGLSFKENAFAKAALAGHNPFVFDNRAGFARIAKLLFDKPPFIPGRFVDVLVDRNKANRKFLDSVFNRLRQPAEYDVLDNRLGKLTMPVLAVWCRDDRIMDPSALDTLRKGLTSAPSISVTVINGCGHVPEIEKPKAVARILTGFAIAH